MLKRTSGLLGIMLVATTLASTGASASDTVWSGCAANGVCYQYQTAYAPPYQECADPVSLHYQLKPYVDKIRGLYLKGAPRVRGVYVATTYNVIINGSVTNQVSIDRDPAYKACVLVHSGSDVAVQGCRYRTQWLRSYCTAWSRLPRAGYSFDTGF